MKILFCLLAAVALPAPAETVTLCYNYGCQTQATITFGETDLQQLADMLAPAADADDERFVMSRVIGRMHALSGEQSPVWRDRGGNYLDDGADGGMDCIDHTATTTAFLALLERHGWMRFHTVEEPVRRGVFALHWTARIRETGSGQEFAVDSWFSDNGDPVAVFALQAWRNGARANGR